MENSVPPDIGADGGRQVMKQNETPRVHRPATDAGSIPDAVGGDSGTGDWKRIVDETKVSINANSDVRDNHDCHFNATGKTLLFNCTLKRKCSLSFSQ